MQILKMIKNRLHTKDKEMKYIKRLAIENTELKNQVEKLTSQLEELSEHCKKMAETVDNFERYSDKELRSMIEDMIGEELPSNLDEICDVYDSYDFDEFITMEDVEDQKYVTIDDINDDIIESVHKMVDDKMKDYQPKDIDIANPEIFRSFLNKLAKYIAEQTEK